MADQQYVEGVRLFKKNDKTPHFVIASGVISLNDLIAFAKANPKFLTEYNGVKQIPFQILISTAGNPYMAVDTYKKGETQQTAPVANTAVAQPLDDLPF